MTKKFFKFVIALFLISVTLSLNGAGRGEDGIIPAAMTGTIADLQKSLHDIAKEVTPSVVFIGTEKTITQNYMDPFEFFFNPPSRNNQNNQKGNERKFKQSGLGSGVIYQKKGKVYYIVTNNHVIEGADAIKVSIDQKKFYEATIMGSDPETDVAIIKIETPDNLKVASFGNSDKVGVADFVSAIGNPFGLSGTMTFGIVSAIGRSDLMNDKLSLTDFIQTDAAINPGNSGGPLINIDGEVIGINTLIYSQTGGSVGIGFAIPINVVKSVATEIIEKGKKSIDHGFLGITYMGIDEESAKTLSLGSANGMLVREVFKGSPAEKADIKVGDVILEANGKKLDKMSDLSRIVGTASPGAKINFKIQRDGKTISKDVVIGNRNEMTGKSSDDSSGKKSSLDDYGIDVSDMNKQLKNNYKIGDNVTGVVVTTVLRGGLASRAGLTEGDVIFKVNTKKINNVNDLTKELESNKDRTNYFFIIRDNKEQIILM